MHKIFLTTLAAILLSVALTGCSTDADVVNNNLDKAAENFEINRRIVVVNDMTDRYMLTIEGRCDITPKTGRVLVTCKVADGEGEDAYKRHQIYRSKHASVVVEQIDATKASAYHYKVTFKPQAIIPDVDLRGSTTDTPSTD